MADNEVVLSKSSFRSFVHPVRLWTGVALSFGLLRIFFLIEIIGPSASTDLIVFLLLLLELPIALYGTGFVLNYTVSQNNYSNWGALQFYGVILGFLAPSIAFFLIPHEMKSIFGFNFTFLLISASGAILGSSSVVSAKLTCQGRPLGLVLIGIPASVSVIIASFVSEKFLIITFGLLLLIGQSIQWLYLKNQEKKLNIGFRYLPNNDNVPGKKITFIAQFLSSISGFAGPTLLQIASVNLPAGDLTILNAIIKVLQSLITLTLGTYLLLETKWNESKGTNVVSFIQKNYLFASTIFTTFLLVAINSPLKSYVSGMVWVYLVIVSMTINKVLVLSNQNRIILWSTLVSTSAYVPSVLLHYRYPSIEQYFLSASIPIMLFLVHPLWSFKFKFLLLICSIFTTISIFLAHFAFFSSLEYSLSLLFLLVSLACIALKIGRDTSD